MDRSIAPIQLPFSVTVVAAGAFRRKVIMLSLETSGDLIRAGATTALAGGACARTPVVLKKVAVIGARASRCRRRTWRFLLRLLQARAPTVKHSAGVAAGLIVSKTQPVYPIDAKKAGVSWDRLCFKQ